MTLNPAGAEYGGRQKLPGNIQALFRPIVMQQPEPKEIARVMLFVEGFKQAAEISERVVELFDMCAKILSHQRHYDWGLRELKTVLLACGEGLSATLNASRADEDTKDASVNAAGVKGGEMQVVYQCLRASTMSKLALHDVTRFDMLLQNVFPEIKITTQHKSPLHTAIADAFAALGLCHNQMQMDKCLQLYEQLRKRMGVVVMGPPGCGKSTIISILRQALTNIYAKQAVDLSTTYQQQQQHHLTSSSGSAVNEHHYRQIRVHYISPKSMSRVQLLGRLDPDTRQWLDGVLTHTAVSVNAEPSSLVHSWIICDGSIDPEWIEALNSVLDDNK